MKKVLLATENESKVKRFKDGLLKNNIEIITINNLTIRNYLFMQMINKKEVGYDY